MSLPSPRSGTGREGRALLVYSLLLASNGKRRRRACPAGAGADGPETSLVFIKRHKKGFCRGTLLLAGRSPRQSACSEPLRCGGLSELQQTAAVSQGGRELRGGSAVRCLAVICVRTPGRARCPSRGWAAVRSRRSARDGPRVRMLHNGLFGFLGLSEATASTRLTGSRVWSRKRTAGRGSSSLSPRP